VTDAPTTAAQEVEELLQFVYLTPVAIARLGPRGALEMLNPKAVQLLHDLDVDVGLADGPTILEALCPGLAARWQLSAGRVGSVIPPQRCSPPRALGAPLHLMVHVVRPDARCTMLAIEDVTTIVEQERELARQRQRIGLVLEHIQGYCVAMLDHRGCVAEWNPSVGRMFGMVEGAVVGRPLFDLVATEALRPPPPDHARVEQVVTRQGWCRLQAPWRRGDGQVLWGDCVVTPVVEPDGCTSGYVAVIRDVTDEHQRTQRLVDATLTDPLTGLYNRRGLDERVEALRHRPGGAPNTQSWIMVDIDHFKRVNDTYGHDGGDAVLKAVAAALKAIAREGDTLARLGGEEFVLVLPDVSVAVAAAVAERLRVGVELLSTETAGRTVWVTASFGVAQQAPGEVGDAALERADKALYRAKHEGRNRVVLARAPGSTSERPV